MITTITNAAAIALKDRAAIAICMCLMSLLDLAQSVLAPDSADYRPVATAPRELDSKSAVLIGAGSRQRLRQRHEALRP